MRVTAPLLVSLCGQRSAMFVVRNCRKVVATGIRQRFQMVTVFRSSDLFEVPYATGMRLLLPMVLPFRSVSRMKILLVLRPGDLGEMLGMARRFRMRVMVAGFRNLKQMFVMALRCDLRQMLMMLRLRDLLQPLLMVRCGNFGEMFVLVGC